MKVWKRCMAAVLSFIIFATSANIAEAAGTLDSQFKIWESNDAEIVAEYYGLDEKQTNILLNGAIDQGNQYTLFAPYDNGTKGKRDLLAVDYINKVIYAKPVNSSGYSWQPVSAVLSAEGEEKETISLTSGICYYNQIEYCASGAFTYSGNSYSVEVTYQLQVGVTTAEQNRILQIPVILAQTATNLFSELRGMRLDIRDLGNMTPYLKQLLSVELPVEEVVTQSAGTVTVEEVNTETDGQEAANTTAATEPAFDSTKHAVEIAAINALYDEYTANTGLILYNLEEKYSEDTTSVLSFAFANGAQVRDNSASIFEHIETLRTSTRLKSVLSELKSLNPELYAELQYVQNTLKSLNGTARKPGPIRVLKEADNWKILDENVKASIFADSYEDGDFAELEAAAYALRSKTITPPTVTSESLLAAELTASCQITIYDVNVTVSGEVVSAEVDNKELIAMEPVTTTIKLLADTSVEDIEKAITESEIEKNALSAWNALNSNYLINSGNYDREATEITKALNQDLDYEISYSPKKFNVKTNFIGNEKLPYGYQIKLPINEDGDSSYEYTIETEDGTKSSFEEGETYKITKDVTITQLEGAEKAEYRLYDFLVEDVQYTIGEDAKQILKNSAVDSPTLKISIPDGSTVGEVVLENGIYSVTAKSVKAGSSMTWEPYIAYVMNGDTVVQEVLFTEGVASWETSDFSHVRVTYRLKIDKVKNEDSILGGNRDLAEEDVLYALNLPNDLVTDVVTQNRLLSGDTGVTVKTLYNQMETVKMVMSQTTLTKLYGYLKTEAGKNAVLILQSSENETVRSKTGEKLGNGAWDFSEDQLALYTYMTYCADTNWSLATYYKKGYYEPISTQSGILANCLESICKDPGFVDFLKGYGSSMVSYKDDIEALVPKLRQLSQQLKPPHEALDVTDADFASLIEYLLTMEGQVEAVDTSNGIYAYTSVRRNGEKAGSIIVSVQAGAMIAKTREISYVMEGSEHILTTEEAAAIQTAITELEAECGLTEDEKQYYDLIQTAIPQAGDAVGKNESVTLHYAAKEYMVTVAGMDDYKATFKYKSDYVIELPAYSDDPDDIEYYCYIINGQEKKVFNGSVGYHPFTKEDLTTLFVNQHYEISVEIRLNISEWDVVPDVKLAEAKAAGKIFGEYFDFDNSLLFLDAAPSGFTKADLSKYVEFETGAGAEVEISVENAHRDTTETSLLATGTIIECRSLDQDGEEKITEIMLILMGDVNKDSLVTEDDMQLLKKNYLGTAAGADVIGSKEARLAADMNGNGTYYDSNDALYIMMKSLYWGNTSGKTYTSVL